MSRGRHGAGVPPLMLLAASAVMGAVPQSYPPFPIQIPGIGWGPGAGNQGQKKVEAVPAHRVNTLASAQDGITNIAEGKPCRMSSGHHIWKDPGAAVDGRLDELGFHTQAGPPAPWWSVNLGPGMGMGFKLTGMEIWNRSDDCQDRAWNLIVQISDDGKDWASIYSNKGFKFGGVRENAPLRLSLEGNTAKFVRILQSDDTPLHLAEVRVFGIDKMLSLYGESASPIGP